MSVIEEPTFLENIFSGFTAYILPGILGLITGVASEKIKNKSLQLKYTLSFQALGTAIVDRFWGQITVAHNNRPINHLNFITLKISNETGVDAKDKMELNVWLDPRSQFLGNKGNYDSGSTLYFETNYSIEYEAVINHPDIVNLEPNISNELLNRLNFVQGNRIFTIPIFNRKSSLLISFLVENFDGNTPKIYFDLVGKGVKLIPEGDAEKAENVKKIAVAVLNLIIYVLAIYWVFNNYPNNEAAIWATIVWGVASYFISLGIYYCFIYFKKLF